MSLIRGFFIEPVFNSGWACNKIGWRGLLHPYPNTRSNPEIWAELEHGRATLRMRNSLASPSLSLSLYRPEDQWTTVSFDHFTILSRHLIYKQFLLPLSRFSSSEYDKERQSCRANIIWEEEARFGSLFGYPQVKHGDLPPDFSFSPFTFHPYLSANTFWLNSLLLQTFTWWYRYLSAICFLIMFSNLCRVTLVPYPSPTELWSRWHFPTPTRAQPGL